MAISTPVARGTANTPKSSGTTIAVTTTGAVVGPAVILLALAYDNLSGTTPTVSAADNSGVGGTYSVIASRQGGSTASASGVWVALVAKEVASGQTVNSGTVVTATFSGAITAKAAQVWEIPGATKTEQLTEATAGGTAAGIAMNFPGTITAGNLVIAAAAWENVVGTPTGDSDTNGGNWTSLTTTATSGGSAATNVTLATQFKLMTSTASGQWNPVWASSDYAAIIAAITPAATGPVQVAGVDLAHANTADAGTVIPHPKVYGADQAHASTIDAGAVRPHVVLAPADLAHAGTGASGSLGRTLIGTGTTGDTADNAGHDGTFDCGTVAAGDLLVVACSGTKGSDTTTAEPWTTPYKSSGTANIGAAQHVATAGATSANISITSVWTIPVTSGGTLVLAYGDIVTSFGCDIVVLKYTGHDGTPVVGAVTDREAGGLTFSPSSATLGATPAAADETLVFVGSDTDAGAGKGWDAGTGFTQLVETTDPGNYCETWVGVRTGSTSATFDWPFDTSGGPGRYSNSGVALIVKAAAGSGSGSHTIDAGQVSTPLVVAGTDLSHANSKDAGTVRPHVVLAPVDLAHANTADAGTVVPHPKVYGADQAHASTIDAGAVRPHVVLAPVDLAHANSKDDGRVIPHPRAAGVDLAHASTIDAGSVSTSNVIAPADLAHPSTIDVGQVVPHPKVYGADQAHGSTIDAGAVRPHVVLAPADLALANSKDAGAVRPHVVLAPADQAHGSTIDAGAVRPHVVVAPADLAHPNSKDAGNVVPHPRIFGADLAHADSIDTGAVSGSSTIAPVDLGHANTKDEGRVIPHPKIYGADAVHPSTIDAGQTRPHAVTAPADLAHGVTLDAGAVRPHAVARGVDLSLAHVLDIAGITLPPLAPADMTHSHRLGPSQVSVVEQGVLLNTADALYVGEVEGIRAYLGDTLVWTKA